MHSLDYILNETTQILRNRGKISFRAIKRQFGIDDEYLEDIVYELVEILNVARSKDNRMLEWIEDPTFHLEKPGDADHKSSDQAVKAERRQLTVMFIDIVGSTELSRILDPEDLRDILYAYQELFDAVVVKHQGLVVQHLGDGIMAYFGYPRAHEDDAQRAVMSGLEMLTTLKEFNRRQKEQRKVTLNVRIGVHTGIVVVGATGGKTHSEMLALGEAPNLAAKIQGLAKPNTLVISSETNKLLKGQFRSISLGKFQIKGIPERIELLRVEGEKDISEIELVSSEGLSSFIGREVELTQILERWELARESKGQIVLISGEAGIGKSRLIQASMAEILNGNTPYLVFKCSPYSRNTSLHPVIFTLRSEMNLERHESPGVSLSRLEDFAKKNKSIGIADIPLIANLLSIPLQGKYPEIQTSAGRRKSLIFRSLIKWLKGGKQPSLIVFEDFQWADPSTLELFETFFSRISKLPVLFIGTFRPEFTPHWVPGSHQMQIVLNRLTRQQTESMIHQLAGNIPDVVVSDILDKTDGNPLFVEEVTKLLMESDVLKQSQMGYQLKSSLKTLRIPSTLQDSLMARLDRLGPAKEIAQIGATIGREFSFILVRAISELADEILHNRLLKLVDAAMLLEDGEVPNLIYTFKHALIQEAAYSSLLKKQRQEFHKRIVSILEADFPDLVDTNPELMAHHCSEGGLLEKAIPYWQRAGELAISKSAHQEAIILLKQGLQLLGTLPVNHTHIESEIMLQIALGVPLTAIRGYGSEEVEQAYSRARFLCNKMGDTLQLIPTLYGLWRYYLLTAQYGEAQVLSRQLKELSKKSAEPLYRAIANRATGSTYFYLGDLEKVRNYLDEINVLDSSPETRANSLLFDVVDVWVTARSYESWTLWLQGYITQAFEKMKAAVKMANQLNHPFSMALSVSFATWLHQFNGDPENTLRLAKEGLKISQQNGFAFWIGWEEILEAWATDCLKPEEENLKRMLRGLEHWKALGSRLGTSYFLYLIAERQLHHGRTNEAWATIDEAKTFNQRTREGWWEAEVLRLEGRFYETDSKPDLGRAEKCYLRAIEISKAQKARCLTLRAANDLANLSIKTINTKETFLVLKEALDWFDDSISNQDIREGKLLLKKLEDIQ